MTEKTPRRRLGLLVWSGLLVAGFALYLFGYFPIILRVEDGIVYRLTVADSPAVSAPVAQPVGVKVGLVDSVEMDAQTGRLLITMRLDENAVKREKTPIRVASHEKNCEAEGQLASHVKPILDHVAAVAVAPPAPTSQESLQRIQQSLEKVEKLIPQFEKTIEEYRLLARDSRQAIPDLRKTNEVVQKLIKDVNEIVPDARRLTKSVADSVPDVQALIKSINATMPDLQKTIKAVGEAVPDIRELVKSLTETVPDAQKLVKSLTEAVPDARTLMKSINEAVPVAKETMREITIATRNWSQVGERISVFLKTNEDRLNNIVRETETVLTYMADVFGRENRNNLTTLLRNLNNGTTKLPSIADETELFLRQGRGTLKRMDETFDTLNKATKPNSTETQGMLKNLSEGLEKFNRTMTDVNELMRVIGQSDGTLRRFITDPGLYNHVDDAAILVTRLLPRLDRIMKDFEVFADKLARHPESLGLGGLVRPSSGIKEPPRSTIYPTKKP